MLLANLQFSDFLSVKDYWFAIVSALIGAMLGIAWTKRQFRREREKEARMCMERLHSSLQFNVDRLNQAKGQLEKAEFPNYPLDTAQLNHWISQGHDLISPELLKALDWQRYQLDHLSSKFLVTSQLIALIGSREMTAAERDYLRALRAMLVTHIDGVLSELPSLIEQIPLRA